MAGGVQISSRKHETTEPQVWIVDTDKLFLCILDGIVATSQLERKEGKYGLPTQNKVLAPVGGKENVQIHNHNEAVKLRYRDQKGRTDSQRPLIVSWDVSRKLRMHCGLFLVTDDVVNKVITFEFSSLPALLLVTSRDDVVSTQLMKRRTE